jgi:methylphosphotriester-DNA--protein-cysteine methyltransferase
MRTSNPPPTPAQWQAILDRDTSLDGRFVYGVISTGIFCRPSCPSRPGRPQSVVCFDTAEVACKGGFRTCLRCRPDLPAKR